MDIKHKIVKQQTKNQIDKAIFELTEEWHDVIEGKERIWIKPNLVGLPRKGAHIDAVMTSPVVLESLIYRIRMQNPSAEIIVGDAPSVDAPWDLIREHFDADYLEERYNIRFIDLRREICTNLKHYGRHSKMTVRKEIYGKIYELKGKESAFYGTNPLLYRGVYSKRWHTIKNHLWGKHKYCVTKMLDWCDLFIQVPKLKTHHKVGMTCNMKGLVGMNADKDYLVHWRIGYPFLGGDEYPTTDKWYRKAYIYLRHIINDVLPEKWLVKLNDCSRTNLFNTNPIDCDRGAWQGNDTTWRMVRDLYTIVRKSGKPTLSLVDGLIAGEGNGPFYPDKKIANILIAGDDFCRTDYACAAVLGFDHNKIRYLTKEPLLNGDELTIYDLPELNFKEPSGWDLKYRK